MPQGFEIIRARVKDDAVVLIDRLMRSKQPEVVLVLPKNSIIAADLNSLRILNEEAESIGKTLSLSVDNDKIKSFAEGLGMAIYDPDKHIEEEPELERKVKQIKVMADILPPSAVQAVEETEEEVPVEIPELQEELSEEKGEEESDYKPADFIVPEPVIYETKSGNSDLEKNLENFYNNDSGSGGTLKSKNKFFRFSLNRIIALFVVSGFVLFGMAMYLVLPKANIAISLKKIPLKIQIPVTVSKDVNSLNLTGGIMPGQYFSMKKTGSKVLVSSENSSKIGGVIEVYNAYSSAVQKLVAQTRFETKDGKTFRTQNPVIIPGAKMSGAKLIPSSIKVNVIGDGVSDDYLIGPSYFTIPGFKESPKYAGFYAKSLKPMARTGDASLSREELEKNKNELSDKLAQELKTDILSTLKDSDLQLIKGASAVKIDDYKLEGNVLNMKITWQALFFKGKDLRALINYFVSSHFNDLKNFTFEDNIVYPDTNRVDFKKGELSFSFNIDKNNALPIDINGFKKELAGKNENEMRAVISEKNYINSAAISLWPFWVKSAPVNTNKINIAIDPALENK